MANKFRKRKRIPDLTKLSYTPKESPCKWRLDQNSHYIQTDEFIQWIADSINEFTSKTPNPTIYQYCYTHNVPNSSLEAIKSNHNAVMEAMERLKAKEIAQTRAGGLLGYYSQAMAQFACRAAGLSDTQRIEIKGVDPILIKDSSGQPIMTLGVGNGDRDNANNPGLR